MEKRLTKLEDFQKKWKFYFWCIVVVMGFLSLSFGWKIYDVSKALDDMSNRKDKLTSELRTIRQKAIEAETISKNASLIAGSLQAAVDEARKASQNAKNKSNDVARMHKDILQKVNAIKKISQEANATAKVVESRLRQTEIILAKIKNSKSEKQPEKAPLKKMTVELSGYFMQIHFIEGPSPYNNVKINQNSYRGNVYIPEGCSAKITGRVKSSNFIIAKELNGRVIDNTSGYFNKWIQNKKGDEYYFK